MKKKLVVIFAVISMMVTPSFAATRPSIPKGLYPYFAKVYTVRKESKLWKITTLDTEGRMFAFWSYDGDWFKGDGVAMIMWDRGTPRVADDMVLSARYCRY